MPKYPSVDEHAEIGEASVPTIGSSVACDKCSDITELFHRILSCFELPSFPSSFVVPFYTFGILPFGDKIQPKFFQMTISELPDFAEQNIPKSSEKYTKYIPNTKR